VSPSQLALKSKSNITLLASYSSREKSLLICCLHSTIVRDDCNVKSKIVLFSGINILLFVRQHQYTYANSLEYRSSRYVGDVQVTLAWLTQLAQSCRHCHHQSFMGTYVCLALPMAPHFSQGAMVPAIAPPTSFLSTFLGRHHLTQPNVPIVALSVCSAHQPLLLQLLQECVCHRRNKQLNLRGFDLRSRVTLGTTTLSCTQRYIWPYGFLLLLTCMCIYVTSWPAK
jgi:hypothetical protein